MKRLLLAALAAMSLLCFSAPASAACNYTNEGKVICMGPAKSVMGSQHLYYDDGAGRPAGCPKLWCACWGRLQAGISDKSFNRALHWLTLRHVGSRQSAPVVGSWAVLRRKGGGHVGKVVGVDGSGNPIIRSGNHNRRVGTGTYPRSRVLAYVQP